MSSSATKKVLRGVGAQAARGAWQAADFITGEVANVHNRAQNAADGIFNMTGNAMDAAGTGVQGVASHVIDATTTATAPIFHNRVTGPATRPFIRACETFKKRYKHAVSPVVIGQGGDFGKMLDPSKEAVVLRIEIATTPEVKAMRYTSIIVTLLTILATIALTVIKYKVNPSEALKANTDYFYALCFFTAVCLAGLLVTFAVFLDRVIRSWRQGAVWSRRRAVISRSAMFVLVLQILNLAVTVAGAAYSTTSDCAWQSHATIIMGYTQWTLWNCTFFTLVALAHNGSIWRGSTAEMQRQKSLRAAVLPGAGGGEQEKKVEEEGGSTTVDAATPPSPLASIFEGDDSPRKPVLKEELQQGELKSHRDPHILYGGDYTKNHSPIVQPAEPCALVMDAPFTVHLRKLLVWVILQVILTLLFAKFETQGFGDACKYGKELVCGPPSTLSICLIAFLLVAVVFYFLMYTYFAWRTDKDIRSRPYAEMRFARMVFGVQNEEVLPVFTSFTLCTILLLSVRTGSCWTFVETWMGVIPLNFIGTCMAATLSFYFMPKKPGSKEEILRAWLQEFCWTSSELPVALRRRNAKLSASKKLAKEPMFCIETAIKLLYFSNLVYTVNDDEVQNVIITDAQGVAEDDGDDEVDVEQGLGDTSTSAPTTTTTTTTTPTTKSLASDPTTAAAQIAVAVGDPPAVLPPPLGPTSAAVSQQELYTDAVEQQQNTADHHHHQIESHKVAAGDGDGDEEDKETAAAAVDDVENEVENDENDEAGEYEVSPGCGNITDAMALYRLENNEVIYHKGTDTRTLLAWGGTTLVVAFKGTSSLENVLTDLNLFKVHHPPARKHSLSSSWGLSLIQVPVRVHRGFYDAWTASEYDKRVLERIGEILTELGGPQVVEILVTGHSLGGALATLGAHAIKTTFPASELTVYTYGQPRVGNRAFAHEYNGLISAHFAVINDQDPVARVPKGDYKQVGDRVIIDGSGDIVVRPTYLERHIMSSRPVVSDHFLDKYRLSFMRGIKVQFTERRLETGQPGARELARWVNLNTTLLGVHLSPEELDDPALEPMTDEEVAKRTRSMSKKSGVSFNCGAVSNKMTCGCGAVSRKRKKKHGVDSDDDTDDDDHDEVVVQVVAETDVEVEGGGTASASS